MSVLNNTRCSVNSGLSVEQALPNELLRQIFLYCDPATLYTSVRPISRSWKHAVEHELIASHFNKDWRVGLRVVRKLPASSAQQLVGSGDDDELDRLNLLQRRGAIEQPTASASHPNSIVHVVPLQFQGYDAESVSLKFGTGVDWHALFRVPPKDPEAEEDEDEDEDDFGAARARSEAKADSARLELDFGLVWRFPDDGQDADPVTTKDGKVDEAASWGSPDPENGWLSRFYCSNYDVKRQSDDQSTQASGSRVLRSTPLARRIRQATLHPNLEESLREESSASYSPPEVTGDSLVWSDEGHEYMSMDLSLGMEFFVRRSARANQLLRRLEAEAVAADAREAMQSLKKGKGHGKKRWVSALNSASASGWATPNQVASPPPSRTTGAIDSRRRPQLLKLQQSQGSVNTLGQDLNKSDKSSAKAKAREASGSFSLLSELDDDELSFVMGQMTPAGTTTPMTSSLFSASSKLVSRLGSVAPSRRGGGSVALSSTNSSDSRSSGRAGAGSTPRATFSAKLCRAELMPSPAGWVGGDKLGRGSHRDAEIHQGLDSHMETALLRSGVTSPATWSWSR